MPVSNVGDELTNRFVLITGCSGGGKSTLLAELASRGYQTVEEPGRRIVRLALERDNRQLLPWVNAKGFARRAIEVALSDRLAVPAEPGWVFFDRGLVDAALALDHVAGSHVLEKLDQENRYHRTVFLTPPWPEIYRQDNERMHAFDEACTEFRRLETCLPWLGYQVILLPKVSVPERADLVLHTLDRE